MKIRQIKPNDVFSVIGGTATVIERIDCRHAIIEFNDEHKHRMTIQCSHLRRGVAKNPYNPVVVGVGFFGVGEYIAKVSGKNDPAYESWHRMLIRCYCPDYQARQPTYAGVTVCNEWHNFQVYAAWFHSQKNSDNAEFHLDKDMMIMGSKVYSPETCSFVPQEINALLNCNGNARGSLPIGVTANNKGYMARLSKNGKRVYLGTYENKDQAFAAYKIAKEKNVKDMATKWREIIDHAIYENLMNWEVMT